MGIDRPLISSSLFCEIDELVSSLCIGLSPHLAMRSQLRLCQTLNRDITMIVKSFRCLAEIFLYWNSTFFLGLFKLRHIDIKFVILILCVCLGRDHIHVFFYHIIVAFTVLSSDKTHSPLFVVHLRVALFWCASCFHLIYIYLSKI